VYACSCLWVKRREDDEARAYFATAVTSVPVRTRVTSVEVGEPFSQLRHVR
jgi:hypothetical protein